MEQQHFGAAQGANRNDVPGVGREDVGGEEIHFVFSVGLALRAGIDGVTAGGTFGAGGFDLHAPEVAGAAGDEVEFLAVTPGPGQGETIGDGDGSKADLSDFSLGLFGAGDGFGPGGSHGAVSFQLGIGVGLRRRQGKYWVSGASACDPVTNEKGDPRGSPFLSYLSFYLYYNRLEGIKSQLAEEYIWRCISTLGEEMPL